MEMPKQKKQHKRGVTLPMRVILVGLMVALQLALFIFLLFKLSADAVWVYTAFQIISFLAVVVIVVRRGNPSLKLPWIIFILALPLIGGIIYIFWGGTKALPHLKRRMRTAENQQHTFLTADPQAEEALASTHPSVFRQSVYLKNTSGFPVHGNTFCEYHAPCDAGFERVLEELRMATNYIFMEFFILAEGKMWNQIYAILKQKAAAGVDVRIMYDDFGSCARQYRGFAKRLRDDHIKVSVFNPLRPSLDIFMNNRNHQKVIIIDGKTAISGGFNVGDEYINAEVRFGHWMDNVLILKGDAVKNFIVMFCAMWNFTTRGRINATDYFGYNDRLGRGFVQPYADGPLNDVNPAEGLYLRILGSAKNYVYITTPYLILDNEMLTALITAAQSGVDVRIVTPKIRDKWYVHPVTQSYYEELLEAGVRIFEYTPGFIHSKVFVSDDTVATVGTVNMDFRSFYYHFECGVWICDNPVIEEIKEDVLSNMVRGEEILLKEWRHRPLRQKIKQAALRLFAPLM